MPGVNRYKADLRDFSFLLFEQFGFDRLAGAPPFEMWGRAEAEAVLSEVYRLAREVLGPLNSAGDEEGCHFEHGQVRTPQGFKDAWLKLYESGFKSISIKPEHGGQGAPKMLHSLVEEVLSGANPAFNMYPGLAQGAAELLAECATPNQIERYALKMFAGTWGGTMCLTEPHAGSDVGAAKTTARRDSEGGYHLRGTKIFISGGDHDLTENIIHLVLARVEGAPPGTKGLSLFIVPKRRVLPDGSLGPPNDVQVGSIEHKMGIHGSSTCVLNFGDNGACLGELVGGVENAGIAQMFRMMNGARIAVGLQGLAAAAACYLSALDYAKDRKQGPHYTQAKDASAPKVPILRHPDIRRMLLEMKAYVEGIRALAMKLACHRDWAEGLAERDAEKSAYHSGQVDLLTPLLKSFASDEGFRICAQAIQVYGGAGYLKDHPVEQYTRDAKIFSIYEGTNHIQAMDLIGRKLTQAAGKPFRQFLADVAAFEESHRNHEVFAPEVELLRSAREAVTRMASELGEWASSSKPHLSLLSANRFLKMMSELTVGWLLLEAGVIAEKAQKALSSSHPDRAFYEGKKQAALWFARNVLPGVESSANVAALKDESAMDIPDEAFAIP